MRKAFHPAVSRTGRGAGIVEFALILPILLSTMIGIVDFGRAFWYNNTLAEAVRAGSRYAAVHGQDAADPSGPGGSGYAPGPPSTDAKVTEEVRRLAFGLDPNHLSVTSHWPNGDNLVGSYVEVEARYSYRPVTPWINDGAPIDLSVKSLRKIRVSSSRR